MTITANAGPIISYGQTLTSTGGITEYNPSAGPSAFYQGLSLLDPRPQFTYQVGGSATTPVYGWLGNDRIICVDQIPTTLGENSIALTQSATTATTRTLTLTTTNTANATVGVSIVRANDGVTVTGLLAIDSAMSPLTYGSDAAVTAWNPGTAIARTVRIEGSSDDSAGAFTIKGYDIYGFAMQETVIGGASTTAGSTFVSSQKAFKYIASITASGTVNSTGVIVGVTDIYGFPFAVSNPGRMAITTWSTGTLALAAVAASTGFTPASTVATQTSTTPDVRGTWSSTTASNSVLRWTFAFSPSPAALNSTGLFGATQYSTLP